MTVIQTYQRLKKGMSNFDHTIDDGLEEELKKGNYFAQYAAWNFCGYVYWDKKDWACEVWANNSHIETIHADTLQEIMNQISEKYGDE